MMELPFLITTALLLLILLVLVLLFQRLRSGDDHATEARFVTLENLVRSEITTLRQESSSSSRDLRQEIAHGLKDNFDSLFRQISAFSLSLNQFQTNLENRQAKLTDGVEQRLRDGAAQTAEALESLRSAIDGRLGRFEDGSGQKLEQIRSTVDDRLREGADAMAARMSTLHEAFGSFQAHLSQQLSSNTEQTSRTLTALRDSLSSETAAMRKDTTESLSALRKETTENLSSLRDASRKSADETKGAVEQRLHALQTANEQKLEQMRNTVEEKLQGTLEKRLGESFRHVSERLEQVHKGLGEMQSLANGVGDLKKVLTNVKTRGTWGEIQLGALLEQILTPDQYDSNVMIVDNRRVEFAVKLPGNGNGGSERVLLPIDSKFPMEDYARIVEAAERSDAAAVEAAGKQLEASIKAVAKAFADKYLKVPITTDFGILFLPTEGLYSEVLRRPGLLETLQSTYGVLLTGPTTLAALLTSLRVGFRTLAIQEHASEVQNVLGAVKKEMGGFGDLLVKVRKKINEAGKTIDDAEKSTRKIEKSLRDVETTSVGSATLLELSADDEAEDTRETRVFAAGSGQYVSDFETYLKNEDRH